MSTVDGRFRDAPGGRMDQDGGTGFAARQDLGARRDGLEARTRDRTPGGRNTDEVASKAEALRRRIDEARDVGERRPEDGVEPRTTLLAVAQWSGGAEPAPREAVAVASDSAARTARSEATAERAAQRIEAALAAEDAPAPGRPIDIRIDLAEFGWPIRSVTVTLAAGDLSVTILRDPALDPGTLPPAAQELADALARRFGGRRITIAEMEREPAEPTRDGPFAVIGAILGGRG